MIKLIGKAEPEAEIIEKNGDTMASLTSKSDFVSREVFQRLLISRQRLQRCDDHWHHVRGLADEMGRYYRIREFDLFPPINETLKEREPLA